MLHVDPGESYGAGWGALAENPDGVGWRVPGVATDAIPEPAIAPSSAPDALAPPRDGERDILLPAAHTAPAPTRAPSASILAPDPDALGARRGYVLDLAAPKLVFCADAFVDALVASGAHKYVEFKPLEATYVFWDGAFHRVPASRAEVFRDRAMSPGDKRALMRFLKRVLRAAEDAGAAVGSRDPDDANRAVGAPEANGATIRGRTRRPRVCVRIRPSVRVEFARETRTLPSARRRRAVRPRASRRRERHVSRRLRRAREIRLVHRSVRSRDGRDVVSDVRRVGVSASLRRVAAVAGAACVSDSG